MKFYRYPLHRQRSIFFARLRLLPFFWVLWLYSNACYAVADPRFVSRAWSVEQGLPHNIVNRVVQDAKGFLWVATGAGLARFDGISFEEFPTPHRAVASASNIRDLIAQPDGSLLILPASGGIFEWKDGLFSAHPASADLARYVLLEIFAEPSGVLWAGTSDAEVLRWEKGKVQIFGQKEGILRRVNRISFATDRHGQTWVAAGDFIGSYRGGTLAPSPPALRAIGRSVLLAQSRSGGLWVATSEQLLKVEEDRAAVAAKTDWPAKSGIECLFEDRRGDLWIGTRRDGLYLLSSGKLTHVDFDAHTIFSLHEDNEGNLWAGTSDEGLCRLRPLSFARLDETTGLPERLSSSVCEDESGAIWCANRAGGAIRWKDGVVQRVGAGMRAGRYATRIAPDHKGYVWIASDMSLHRVKTDNPEAIETMDPALRGVQILFGTREGDMWVRSHAGLGFFHNGVYQAVLGPDGAPFTRRVNALAEDKHGSIWIAATGTQAFDLEIRLWEYTGGKLIERISPANWPAGFIHALQFDQRGGLWIASSAGLVLKEGERLTRFTVADGLPDDLLMEVLADDLGYIWCGSRRGFFRVASADLHAVADGRARTVFPTVFGQDDGLQGASALMGGQPRAWKARDGRLWFTTIRGVVGFDPALAETASVAPPVYISAVNLDDQKFSQTLSRLEVPAGQHRLSFRFAALNYAAPEHVRLRYRLEGFDDNWVDLGTGRVASYARLPPGSYRLHVVAANESGVWNEKGAALPILVAAAWWQTDWFAGLVALVAAGLIAWGARNLALRKISRRLRQLEKEHALERERARIARNLHDELGGSLTQIGLLADRLKRQASSTDLHRTLSQLAWRTRSLAGDLESIVWTVSPQNNSWDRLASFVAQFARRFFRDTEISCVVEGVEGILPRPLSPEAQHEVLAILKESLNNVLKHSRASNVTIRLQLVNEVFELIIRDNGSGFDTGLAEHSERNGLNNIRARGEVLQGDVLIESRVGAGTQITLRVPVNVIPTAATA